MPEKVPELCTWKGYLCLSNWQGCEGLVLSIQRNRCPRVRPGTRRDVQDRVHEAHCKEEAVLQCYTRNFSAVPHRTLCQRRLFMLKVFQLDAFPHQQHRLCKYAAHAEDDNDAFYLFLQKQKIALEPYTLPPGTLYIGVVFQQLLNVSAVVQEEIIEHESGMRDGLGREWEEHCS